MSNRRWGWWLVLFWGVVSLACNMPLQFGAGTGLERPTVSVKEGNSAESPPAYPISTPPPLATAISTQNPPLVQTAQPNNFAPTVTPRLKPNNTVVLPTATIVPLTLEYKISWRLNSNDPKFSFATVQLSATGGEPPYTFYRDEAPTGGPSFSYRWGSCVVNPGSFRVDSADGQSVRIEYFEQTPCE